MPVSSNFWKTKVAELGGKSSVSKGTKVFDLLKKCEKATGNAVGKAAWLLELPYLGPLQKELTAFKAKAGNNAALTDWIDEQLEDIKRQIREGERAANPMIGVKEYLPKVIDGAKRLAASGNGAAYDTWLHEQVRGLDMALAQAVKFDKNLKQFRDMWNPYTAAPWEREGANVTKGVDENSAEYAKRIKAAAKEIGGTGVQIMAQLKRMHYIA